MENSRHQSNEHLQIVVRLIARSGLLILWGIGIRAVVFDGFQPGRFFDVRTWVYPAQQVIIESVFLTLQGVLVYAVLRPATLLNHPARVFGALLLICYIFCIDYYTLETSYRDYVNTMMIFVGYNILGTAVASLGVIVGLVLKLILKRRSSKNRVFKVDSVAER